MFCELETDSVAIERIRDYEDIPQEPDWETSSRDIIPEGWPLTGRLNLTDVSAKYRSTLPDALKNLKLSIEDTEKVGICGRTGAGKSSLASVILRIIEPHKGEIRLDGVNTMDIGLQELRSNITIVPQDSVLFSGTLRFNLDPWATVDETELKNTLEKLNLPLSPDMLITEGGSNLSMGERQLICLGRAVLR